MATGVTSWSQTAASNATADSAVNWAEGQAPSTVNDSGRGMMASVSKWRDDLTGINVTSGSGTAYTLTSNQTIAANTNGFTIQFTPGTTNTGAVTLSVDSQTAKPIRFLTGTDLLSGSLISGSLYQATYRSATEEWLLHSFDARPYIIPIGGIIPYLGTTAPNSAFVLPYGQAISRSTYAALFALIGTTFGVGDGSTTFNLPDLRGRVIAGKDDMGGSSANRLTAQTGGVNGDTLGATGGSETITISQANLPSVDFAVSIPSGQGSHGHSGSTAPISQGNAIGGIGGSGIYVNASPSTLTIANATLPSMTGTAASGGSGTAANIVQPTMILPMIMRII